MSIEKDLLIMSEVNKILYGKYTDEELAVILTSRGHSLEMIENIIEEYHKQRKQLKEE